MRSPFPLFVAVALSIGAFPACKENPSGKLANAEGGSAGPKENIDAEERAIAAQLKPSKDPISEKIYQYRLKVRPAYNNRRFDELETEAKKLRASKETFENGSWRLVQFYNAFECRDDEPESMWTLHDRIHQDWIAAKPESITARVAYADFLTSYAWHARSDEFADKVTQEGWRLFGERLAAARKVLDEAIALPEKDPYWYMVALTVALGQSWPKLQYDALVTDAIAFEPQFWGYEVKRAHSLLPRWHGEPGDWEAFAEQAAARPGGFGAVIYARIVMNMLGYHNNVFRESKASWPKTREGLQLLRQKYPESVDILSHLALLAAMANDRETAKAAFDELGDTYLPGVWGKPERFAHVRKWAQTGKW